MFASAMASPMRRGPSGTLSFEEVLRGSDFVSIHVPLVREGEGKFPTYHLFNAATFRLMKPTAFLVNTSRGPVVDESDLVAALREGVIAGAALDVFENGAPACRLSLRDPKLENRLRLFSHFASAGRVTRLSTDPNKGMAGRCIYGLMRSAGKQRQPRQRTLCGKQRGVPIAWKNPRARPALRPLRRSGQALRLFNRDANSMWSRFRATPQ